ncbi:MAG: hypothetical protein M0Q43_04135 [Methanothrix sp.]|jgi:hypothetical protein|nr:hypothetical protein [Methanothrix sp.]
MDKVNLGKKTVWQISLDEIAHREALKEELHDGPVKKAVFILEAAVDRVLKELGVDTSKDQADQFMQQWDLGVTVWEHDDERAPQLNGFFFHTGYDAYTPYAWVGDARMNHLGECLVDIQYFQKGILVQSGGVKILG